MILRRGLICVFCCDCGYHEHTHDGEVAAENLAARHRTTHEDGSNPLSHIPGGDPAWEAESDEITTLAYEDGLEAGEPWAIEAFEYRRAIAEAGRPRRPARPTPPASSPAR